MLSLFLVLLVIWAAMVVCLWAGSLWFQAYIYSEPVPGLSWRALAAGTVLATFLVFWGFLDFRQPGNWQSLFDFSSQDVKAFPQLIAVNGAGKETLYQRRKTLRGPAYYDPQTNKLLPTRPQAVIVDEDGQKVRFEPERDAKTGNFLVKEGRPLRYLDPSGRVMTEDNWGQIATFRTGRFWGNLFLNFGHLAIWFGCLWLLLRFQWSHALGIAFVIWVVMTVVIVPMMLGTVENRAKEQPVAVPVQQISQAYVDDRMCIISPSWTA